MIKKALKLQHKSGKRSASHDGMTLGEIESIAGEAGIDPALVRQAAAKLGGRASRKGGSAGLFSSMTYEKMSSRSLSDEELNRLLARVESEISVPGNGRVADGTLTWKSDSFGSYQRGYRTAVTVTSGPNGSRIVLKENLGQLAGGIYGGLGGGIGLGVGIGVGVGVGIGALQSGLFTFLFSCGFTSLSLIFAHFIMKRIYSSHQKRNAELVEKIESWINEST